MDRSAARPGFPRPGDLARLLAPFPGRGEMTLRLTVICALTALVASAYGTPEAALSVYIAFFLIRPDRVLSAILPAMMLLLVSVILGVILLVTTASIDYPILRVSAMALLSAGFLFLASASKLRPIGAILAMIVGFGLDQMGRVPIGEASTRMLLYAWLLVAIPAAAAIVAGLLLAPSPRRLACDRLARRLRLAAERLSGSADSTPAFALALREGNKQILTRLKLSALEGSSSRADVAALRQAAISSIAILGAVDVLRGEGGTGLPDALARSLAGTLEDMAAMHEQGGYPVEIDLALPSVTLPRPRAPPSMKCTTPSCATRNRRMRPLEQPASPTRLPRGRLPPARPHGCVHRADRAQARRLLPARRRHQSRTHRLRAQDHRRGDVLLPAVHAARLARHPHLRHHLLHRVAGQRRRDRAEAAPAPGRLRDRRAGGHGRHRVHRAAHGLHRLAAGAGVHRRRAVGLDRGGPAGHRLRGLPDRLRLLPVRHPGRRRAST